MIVIGHRGAPYEELENSRAAFDAACAGGATRIELDIALSNDGLVIIMHDDHLQRTAHSSKHVAEITAADLKTIRLKNGEPIPLLDEICREYLPKVELNIEIKGRDVALAAAAAEIVNEFGPLRDQVIFSCFHPEPLEFLASSYPHMKRACLMGPIWRWPQIDAYATLTMMRRCNASIVHPWTAYVNETFMDQARNRGWRVFPYCELQGDETESREAFWRELKDLEIDGLCTNYPRELCDWLKKEMR